MLEVHGAMLVAGEAASRVVVCKGLLGEREVLGVKGGRPGFVPRGG